MQKSYEQPLLCTSTTFSAACCLQKTGVPVSWVLKLGRLVQELYEHRLLFTSSMPSSACCLQYVDVLLPSKLKLGTFVQESCKQRLMRMSTMPSSRSCLVPCYVRYFNLQVICIVVETTPYCPHGVELNGAGGQREGEQTFKYLGRRKHLSPVEPTMARKFGVLVKCIIVSAQVVVFQHSVESVWRRRDE